ncbi:MAG: hypothetical protein NC548_54195 [Lachnospiraceae bacterium]|nr:hypothetical protein [Lachnospiraceae bacterium]
MSKTRKPTMKERIKGSWDFLIDGIKSFFTFKFGQARFDFYMIIPTIKGNFEVVVKED